MPTAQDQLSAKIDAFADRIDELFGNDFDAFTPEKQESLVCESLRLLVQAFGTCEYSFNLSIEQYVEYFSDETAPLLPAILEAKVPRKRRWAVSDDTDIAFAAFYALSLIYKKDGNTEALGALCQDPYTNFRAHYPLTNEVLSRYYKRTHDYEKALECDQDVIDDLKLRDIVNHGPCISYASTICRMYDKGKGVTKEQVELASTYIQAAIEYNPTYPKYYYLKGKLAFYRAQRFTDAETFVSICEEALLNLSRARRLLREQQGNYYDNTYAEYEALTRKITDARDRRRAENRIFQDFSDEELRERIRQILESDEATDCLPPNPNLRDGRKYIFISYNHKDFQSVYCDLMLLYHLKIPFQYDRGLPYGEPWDKAVKPLIQSEDCLGVLFYMSQHTVASAAVEKECSLLKEREKDPRYLTVNLERKTSPTDILLQYILDNGLQVCHENGIDNDRIVNFLTMFHDNVKFISKTSANPLDAAKYSETLVSAIRRRFADLIIGE